MRHLRIVVLCLAAVFALAAFAGSASAASPEFGQCVAKEGGKYEDSNCQTKAKGKTGKKSFEWKKDSEVANKKFTGEGGAGVLSAFFDFCVRGNQHINPSCGGEENPEQHQGPILVECHSETNQGEASGKSEIKNVLVKFKGCAFFGFIPCSNTATEEEIDVNVLNGKLGYINKATKEVGVDLNPAKKKALFAQFTCGSIATTEVGAAPNKKNELAYYPGKGGGDGIISPITPINQMTPTYTQEFTVNESFENIPSKFEGKPLQLLEALTYNPGESEYRSAWSRAGEAVTNVNTLPEEGEIKA